MPASWRSTSVVQQSAGQLCIVPRAEKLIELNRCGFITIGGQPGISSAYAYGIEERNRRGYLTGFLQKDKYRTLSAYLNRIDDAPLLYAYNYIEQTVVDHTIDDEVVLITDDHSRPLKTITQDTFIADARGALEALDAMAMTQQLLRRETYYVLVMDPDMMMLNPDATYNDVYNAMILGRSIMLENIVLNAIRTAIPIGWARPLIRENQTLSNVVRDRTLAESPGLQEGLPFPALQHTQGGDHIDGEHILRQLYGLFVSSGVRASKELILATAYDIARSFHPGANRITIPILEGFLETIDALYLINDVLSLDEFQLLPLGELRTIGFNDGQEYERRLTALLDEQGDLADEAYDYLTSAVKALYYNLQNAYGIQDHTGASLITFAMELVTAASQDELNKQHLEHLLIEKFHTSEALPNIARSLRCNVVPNHPYGYIVTDMDEVALPNELLDRLAAMSAESLEQLAAAAGAPAGPAEVPVGTGNLRRQEQLAAAQHSLRLRTIPTVTPKELKTYHKNAFGKTKTIFDAINQENVNVKEYINDDPDNMIIKIINASGPATWFTSNKTQIKSQLPMYECKTPDSMSVMYDTKLLNLAPIGCTCQGVADYDTVLWLASTPYQVLVLHNTGRRTGTLVSYDARYNLTYVSEFHCQTGTELTYYATYVPTSLPV